MDEAGEQGGEESFFNKLWLLDDKSSSNKQENSTIWSSLDSNSCWKWSVLSSKGLMGCVSNKIPPSFLLASSLAGRLYMGSIERPLEKEVERERELHSCVLWSTSMLVKPEEEVLDSDERGRMSGTEAESSSICRESCRLGGTSELTSWAEASMESSCRDGSVDVALVLRIVSTQVTGEPSLAFVFVSHPGSIPCVGVSWAVVSWAE